MASPNTNQDPQKFVYGSPSSFDPSYYQVASVSPAHNGYTNGQIAGFQDNHSPATGNLFQTGYTVSYNEFVLKYGGYLFAPQDGPYTVVVDGADNYMGVWIGPGAFSGTNGAALIATDFRSTSPHSASITLSQGDLVPLLITMGAGGKPNKLAVRILAPDGTVMLESEQAESPYVVQYPCSGYYSGETLLF